MAEHGPRKRVSPDSLGKSEEGALHMYANPWKHSNVHIVKFLPTTSNLTLSLLE